MAEVSTFRCDECGKLKPDEPTQLPQHWYRAARVPGAVVPRFLIVSWEDNLMQRIDWESFAELARVECLDLCGLPCAVKAMTKAMEQSG